EGGRRAAGQPPGDHVRRVSRPARRYERGAAALPGVRAERGAEPLHEVPPQAWHSGPRLAGSRPALAGRTAAARVWRVVAAEYAVPRHAEHRHRAYPGDTRLRGEPAAVRGLPREPHRGDGPAHG